MLKFEYQDIMEKLKACGYSSSRLRKEKIFGEATLTRFRNNGNISIEKLVKVCELTDSDICDIVKLKKVK